MKTLYLVTGANGHLGSAICKQLRDNGKNVRGLVLQKTDTSFLRETGTEICFGDVTDVDSLKNFFACDPSDRLFVLHTAGIVDIHAKTAVNMQAVNVDGTKNMIDMCIERGVQKFVYVSSVHAIPEKPKGETILETREFSPDLVIGGYAKSKAKATALVLENATAAHAVVVHPSGIIGPYPGAGNHLVQLVKSYITGKLTACVGGGYDFVDVRDVANGVISACERGAIGECYILSGKYFEIKRMLAYLRAMTHGKRFSVLPMWLAKAAAPLLTLIASGRHQKPLYTKYSLYTLTANGNFSNAKARQQLAYMTRDFSETLSDTVAWLNAHEQPQKKHAKTKLSRRRKVTA